MIDASIGGHQLSKSSRGAAGKIPVNFVVEHLENHIGFRSARLVKLVNSEQTLKFARQILPNSEVSADVFPASRVPGKLHRHEAKAPRPKMWMNGFRRLISSLATSKVFWREPFKEYCINTFGNILTSLFSTTIANSENLSCQINCYKPLLIMCRFKLSLFTTRGM